MATISINTQDIRAQLAHGNAIFSQDFWFGRFMECLAHEAEEDGHSLVQDQDVEGLYLIEGDTPLLAEEFIQQAICGDHEAWLAVQRGFIKH